MKRRQWDSKTKTKIVLEGLGGRPVGELCTAHEISQTQYYKWRERFLAGAHQAFETEGVIPCDPFLQSGITTTRATISGPPQRRQGLIIHHPRNSHHQYGSTNKDSSNRRRALGHDGGHRGRAPRR